MASLVAAAAPPPLSHTCVAAAELQLSLHCPCRPYAALVSNRWHAAAHAPALLQSMTGYCSSLQRLQSLTTWLLRHGRHVCSFSLHCSPCSYDRQECLWELPACLAALAETSALQRFKLSFGSYEAWLCTSPWCPALRQLQSLELENEHGRVHLNSSLAGLVAVTRLALSGESVTVAFAAQLPPNVERLALTDERSVELPRQVSPGKVGAKVEGWMVDRCVDVPAPGSALI